MLKIISTNAKKNYINNYMHTTNSKNQYNINRYTQYERKQKIYN